MKIGEVKGARGLRKLIKELAITVSTGKHDNELVGIAKLPLKVSYLIMLNLNPNEKIFSLSYQIYYLQTLFVFHNIFIIR